MLIAGNPGIPSINNIYMTNEFGLTGQPKISSAIQLIYWGDVTSPFRNKGLDPNTER